MKNNAKGKYLKQTSRKSNIPRILVAVIALLGLLATGIFYITRLNNNNVTISNAEDAISHAKKLGEEYGYENPGDTLVVTKLDRFAWTAIDGVSTVRDLFDREIRVHILNMGLVENTITGNLILTVMLAFAEYERGMIVERTQTGKAIARQNPNFREGRPKKYTMCQLQHAMRLLDSGNSYKQVEAMTGISKSTLIRERRN